MTTKFTPGPWTEGASLGYVAAVNRPQHGKLGRFVAHTDGRVTTEEQRANVQLIAAAPELYEALEAFAELGQNLDQAKCHAGMVDSIHCARCSKVFAARAALKKARGEK